MILFVIYEVSFFIPDRYRQIRPFFNGLLIAAICIIVMSMPFEIRPGIIFDTRSILLSITAFVFGLVPAATAVVFAAVYRIMQGGSGAGVGVMVIVLSTLIGLVWRQWSYKLSGLRRWLNVLAMSVSVHGAMLGLMLFLPSPENLDIINRIALPVMVVYPAASLMLGLLLLSQQDHKVSVTKHRSYIDNAPNGVFVIDEKGRYIEVNRAATEMTGYSNETLLNMSIKDITAPESMPSSFRIPVTSVFQWISPARRRLLRTFFTLSTTTPSPMSTTAAFSILK